MKGGPGVWHRVTRVFRAGLSHETKGSGWQGGKVLRLAPAMGHNVDTPGDGFVREGGYNPMVRMPVPKVSCTVRPV